MLPGKFLDHAPTLFASFVVCDIDGLITRVGFESGYWFSILEDKIGTPKTKLFFQDVTKVWGDWIRRG